MDYILNLYKKLAELKILNSHAHNLEHKIKTDGYQPSMKVEYTTIKGAMDSTLTAVDSLDKPDGKTKNDIVMMLALRIENEEILPVCQDTSEHLVDIKAVIDDHPAA